MDFKQHAVQIFDFQILHLQANTPLFFLVLVLVLVFCLNRLLFRPVLRTLDKREQVMRGLRERVEGQQAELARLTESYQQQLARVRVEVEQVRTQAQAEARAAIEAVLQRAKQDADAQLRTALDELKRDADQARAGLAQSARRLAADTVQRLLN